MQSTRVSAYYDKQSAILEIARGRRVLHLGCVGHEDGNGPRRVRLAGQSLHGLLSRAADVVGVDHSAEVVGELARLGVFRNIVVADVQRLAEAPIDGPFEVIVAGDIIEHVSNPGLVLEGIKRFCRADTRVVLTTPHAFGLPNYLRFLLGRYYENTEHVMTFNTPQMRNLLERHGYRVREMSTCHQPNGLPRRWPFRCGKAFLSRFPRFGGTLFVVAEPDWL